jgi:hypothetical protein
MNLFAGETGLAVGSYALIVPSRSPIERAGD